MTSALDTLTAALERLDEGPRVTDLVLRRQRLDLLIAASDDDAAAAVARFPEPLGDVLSNSPTFWLSYLGERPALWLSGALALLPEPLAPTQACALLSPLARYPVSAPALRVYERLLDDPKQRARAARMLASHPRPDAAVRALLRRHDGPTLDPEVRLAARIGDTPGEPVPDLADCLGPGVAPKMRGRALAWLLDRPDHASLHADALPLVEGCLDDGVAPAAALRFLLDHPATAGRRSLFDRLWPIAQAGRPIPWKGVDAVLFFAVLAVCAPSPGRLAALLDSLADPKQRRALIKAITEHPHTDLVPALERCSQASPDRATRKLARDALDACLEAFDDD